ncbi:hypothetical protein BC829DRAFT_26252 [Chytridium lagenaria]|nr:hypothetical protein BC829DRAFT_26252 [Chytridium lagenaria]
MVDLNDLIEKIAAMRLETPSITFKDVEKILREEKGITESSSMMKKAFGKAGRTIGKQKDASEVEAKKQAEADEREQRKRDREQGLPERTTSTAAMSQGPPEYLGFISKFPKHLPHLYPGGPEWTKNPSAYFPPSMMPSVKVALDSSWQQRTMDRRYYFVNEHYSDFGGMQNVKRTCLEHQAIHARLASCFSSLVTLNKRK